MMNTIKSTSSSSLLLKRYTKYIIFSITTLVCGLFLYNTINYNDSIILSNNQQSLIVNSQTKIADSNSGSNVQKNSNSHTKEYNYQDIKQFTTQVMELMHDFKPREVSGKQHSAECSLETLRIDPDYGGPVYSLNYLSKCLVINYNIYEDLKFKHLQLIKNLPTTFPENMYQEGSRGIVMVGGLHYSMLGYLVIRILRERNTTLPIEVFMPPGTHDDQYCNEVLPNFNAKCISLERIMDSALIDKLQVKGYQLKSLLLLSSSFNDMLYIDSDNYPLYDVNPIFDSQVYKDHGMILWPDFWRRATSPLYYDIAGLKIGEQVRFGVDTVTNQKIFRQMELDLDNEVSLHDRLGTIPDGTSESSSIFLNKKTHLKTLLLSLYYNLNGPENYYSLLSQDTFGEGDKETFAAAAVLTGEQFWQVKTRAQPGGALLHIGKRPRSTTMIQYNPIVDYEIYQELSSLLNDVKMTSYDKARVPEYYNSHNKNISFVHYNLGKLNPLTMIGWNRRYGYDLTDIGFDFELKNVELMVEMFCSEDKKIKFEYLGSQDERLCQESNNLYERMLLTLDKVIIDKLDLGRLEPFTNI